MIVVATGWLLATAARAGVAQWTADGPAGGFVTQVAVDPNDASTLWAVEEGELYRGMDRGRLWERIAEAPPGMTGVVLDPTSPGVVYAVRGHRGASLSVDGGASWQSIADFAVRSLAIDPGDPQRLYAVNRDFLAVSDDGGRSWDRRTEPVIDTQAFEVALDPAAPEIVYFRDRGLWRSADRGATWERVEIGAILGLAVAPGTVYADPVGQARAILRSRDGGVTFERVALSGLPDGRLRFLVTDQEVPETVYAVHFPQRFIVRSHDGGATWVPLTSLPAAEVLALTIGPEPGELYLGTEYAGVFRSTDEGLGWEQRAEGFPPPPIHAVEAGVVEAGTRSSAMVYAGTPGGLHRSSDGGASWSYIGFGDLNLFTDGLWADPRDPLRVFAGRFGLLVSEDGGDHWAFTGLDRDFPTELLVFDPRDPAVLYAAGGRRLMRSDDGGTSWRELVEARRALDPGNPSARFTAMAVDPLEPETLYLGTPTIILRSFDGGASWGVLSADFGASDIIIDSRDSRRLYVASGLWRSLDGGSTWERWREGLPPGRSTVQKLALVPEEPATLYATLSGRGAFARPLDGTRPWRRVGDVIPGQDLAVRPGPPRILHASGGRGLLSYQTVPETDRLTVRQGRFKVAVEWRDPQGGRGSGTVAVAPGVTGQPADLASGDSAVVSFFAEDDWEMLLKVLDGRQVNGRHWVLLAAATDVGFTTVVTDTRCGSEKRYVNPLGLAAPAVVDVTAFSDTCEPMAPAACTPTADVLCLGLDRRFQVEIFWEDALGEPGRGRQVRLAEPGLAQSDDSGLFFFFSPDNWELLVKVLDGCAVNGHFWVFGAATTDVEYTLTVTDKITGETSIYFNPLGVAADAINDTAAFPCG